MAIRLYLKTRIISVNVDNNLAKFLYEFCQIIGNSRSSIKPQLYNMYKQFSQSRKKYAVATM